MRIEKPFQVTREKHLDHMVKVVPLIFLGYAIQVFFLSQMKTAMGPGAIVFLGVSLASLIALFIIHDLKHQVTLFEDHLAIEFLWMKKSILYSDIEKTHITNPDESFSHIVIFHAGMKTRLFFVDDAKTVTERMKTPDSERMAA